jgi:hypothetical protein
MEGPQADGAVASSTSLGTFSPTTIDVQIEGRLVQIADLFPVVCEGCRYSQMPSEHGAPRLQYRWRWTFSNIQMNGGMFCISGW